MEQQVEIFSHYNIDDLATEMNTWLKQNLVQIVNLTLTSSYEEDLEQTLTTALILYITNN
jgi:hypothetical protein